MAGWNDGARASRGNDGAEGGIRPLESELSRPGSASGGQQGGQSALEMALLLPVLLLLLVTAIDLGRAYHAYTTLQSAVRVGAGVALANGSAAPGVYGSVSAAQSAIKNLIVSECSLTPALDVNDIVFSNTSSMAKGDSTDITATYRFPLITPLARGLAGGGSVQLRYTITITYL